MGKQPNPKDLARSTPFDPIESYRLTESAYLALANPLTALGAVSSSPQVDSLDFYTEEMWGMVSVIAVEWLGIRLPELRTAWDGPICLPPEIHPLLCLNRTDARALRHDLQRRYFNRQFSPNRLSIFGGYGVDIAEEFSRERDGMEFLARQAEHLANVDDHILVVQHLPSPEWS